MQGSSFENRNRKPENIMQRHEMVDEYLRSLNLQNLDLDFGFLCRFRSSWAQAACPPVGTRNQ